MHRSLIFVKNLLHVLRCNLIWHLRLLYVMMQFFLKWKDWGTSISSRVGTIEQRIDMEQTKCDLREQAARLNTREEYIAWKQRCDEFIELLDDRSRIKHPRLSIYIRQSLIAQIARLESLKDSVRERFMHAGVGYSAGLRWRAIDTAFENHILIGAIINLKHIKPCQFFEKLREMREKLRSNVCKALCSSMTI